MAHMYTPHRALPSDAHAIAYLFALSWKSPFSRLQFGDMQPNALANAMTARIAQQIEENSMIFMVSRDEGTRKVVSVAQWSVPVSTFASTSPVDMEKQEKESETVEEREEREERQTFEDEIYFNSLPPSSNRALIVEFTNGLRKLRQRILQGQPHFLLENLATQPEHRGCGLATRLIEHVLDMADERGVLAYLETSEDNAARGLYESLGFEERGRETIGDLSRFGVREGGAHTHIGFARVPKKQA